MKKNTAQTNDLDLILMIRLFSDHSPNFFFFGRSVKGGVGKESAVFVRKAQFQVRRARSR